MYVDLNLNLLYGGMAEADSELQPGSAALLEDAWHVCIEGLSCSTGSFHTAHKWGQVGTATRASANLEDQQGWQEAAPLTRMWSSKSACTGLRTLQWPWQTNDSTQTIADGRALDLTCGLAQAMAVPQEETRTVTLAASHPGLGH